MTQMTLFNIPSTQTVEQPKTNNIKAETTQPMAESPKNLKVSQLKQGRKLLREILKQLDGETLKTEFIEFAIEMEGDGDLSENEIVQTLLDNIADKPFIKTAVLNKIYTEKMTVKQVLVKYYKHIDEDLRDLILL